MMQAMMQAMMQEMMQAISLWKSRVNASFYPKFWTFHIQMQRVFLIICPAYLEVMPTQNG